MEEMVVTFDSLDGVLLEGTLVTPTIKGDLANALLLVHGGGVTREEGGFFTRMARGLSLRGIASLRFDFRAHGQSGGRADQLTLAGIVNDIRAAHDFLSENVGSESVNLLGASFGGGLSLYYAGVYGDRVARLILINPLLNYKRRLIDEKNYWNEDRISPEASARLDEEGVLPHSPTFMLNRPLINEMFYLNPIDHLSSVKTPTLVFHGTKDTFIPFASSEYAVKQLKAKSVLVPIEGGQHGVAVHDDPQYKDPKTQYWQASVITAIGDWLVDDRDLAGLKL
ncbi:MAG TPA: alpha/beta fold hydrolase [Kineosporiaceae bacterium]|nr:alpha/beta fold hydrolase [Kineosporiaceae bacterium]